MNELEITWRRVLQIWWSLLWRGLLFGFLAGFVGGFIVGFIGAMLHANPGYITLLSGLTGGILAIPVGIWVVKSVLAKKFKNFRIALVPLS